MNASFFFCKCLITVYAQLIEELLIFIDVHDLLHVRVPCEFHCGKDRERVVLIAVRESLKKANYRNFDVLLEALRHFDKVSALKRYKCKGMCRDTDEKKHKHSKVNMDEDCNCEDNCTVIECLIYCDMLWN